jgi:hypothetical protein
MFFNNRLVSENQSNSEIVPGTPLRMPSSPDYESFKRTIQNLVDTDGPYTFGLPENIERSLQRTTSTAVIKQLRALSTVDVEGAKYDREKWRALVC